jgi:Tfp pilus assembly protein PilN
MRSINLLPPKQSARGGARLSLATALPLAAVAAALVGLTFFWQSQTDRLLLKANITATENAKLQAEGVPIEELGGRTDAQRFVDEIDERRIQWKPYLNVILQALPSDARIISLSVGGEQKLQMEVDFQSYQHSVEYVQELEEAPELRDVALLSYNRRTDEHTTLTPNADGSLATVRETVYKAIMSFGLAPQDAREGGAPSGNGN